MRLANLDDGAYPGSLTFAIDGRWNEFAGVSNNARDDLAAAIQGEKNESITSPLDSFDLFSSDGVNWSADVEVYGRGGA